MYVDSGISVLLSLSDLDLGLVKLFLLDLEEHLADADGLLQKASSLGQTQLDRLKGQSRIQDGHEGHHEGVN